MLSRFPGRTETGLDGLQRALIGLGALSTKEGMYDGHEKNRPIRMSQPVEGLAAVCMGIIQQ